MTTRESSASPRVEEWRAEDDVELSQREVPEALASSLEWKSHRIVPDAFVQLYQANRPMLFEIACSPNSILTATVQRLTGKEESARRLSFFNGFDLSSGKGVRQIIQEVIRCRPGHVWLSLECGPFSRIQHLNRRTEQQRKDLELKRTEALKQYVGGLVVYLECWRLGITATWEWSETCEAWRLPVVQKVFAKVQPQMCVVKGCSLGLKSKAGQLLSKGWKLATTHDCVAERMRLPCRCDSDMKHAVCEGSLTRESAYYTPKFAEILTRALMHGCSHGDVLSLMSQQVYSSPRERHGPQGEEGERREERCECEIVCHPRCETMCAACEKAKDMSPSCLTASATAIPLTSQEEEAALRKIGLLHRATGHGPMSQVSHALEKKGADPRIVALAKDYVCPICSESRPRLPRKQASLEPLPPKWSVIQADNGFWTHPSTGVKHQFTLIIDESSRFRMARLLTESGTGGVKSSQMINIYQESWKPIFGNPAKLRADPEGAWRSKALESFFENQNVELVRIPAEAHWQLSYVERAIQCAKAVMNKLAKEDPSITASEALSEAIRTANEREVVRGYSPAQHALGRAPDINGRFHDDGPRVLPADMCENPEGEFKRNVARMKSAEKAFVDWTYSQRLIRAQNSRGRKEVIYHPGDLVYYWRFQKKGEASNRTGGFYGPARVLATETRQTETSEPRPSNVVWIIKGDRLMKTAPEQLRLASQREAMLEDLAHQGEALPWTFSRLSSALGKQWFEDLSQETPTPEQWHEAADQETGRPKKRLKGKQSQVEPRDRGDVGHESPEDMAEVAWCYHAVPAQFETEEARAFWATECPAVSIEVPLPSSKRGKKHFIHDLESYVASALRKRSVEVSERHLTTEEREQFRSAKGEEVKKFIAAQALEALPKHLQPDRQTAMKMRWVLTWKRDEIQGTTTAKARCVILGFLDPMYEHRQVAAPTMGRTSRQMFLTLAAAHRFEVAKGDVSGAFLQGRTYEGEAYVIPTPEICSAMGIEEHSVTRLKRACYGLVDAPLEWFLTVTDFLVSIGFQQCACDPCTFVLFEHDELKGLVVGHVDDFLFAGRKGEATWEDKCRQIRARFKWGEWLENEFVQCGVKIRRTTNGGFELSQGQYIDDLKEISLCAERRRQRESETSEGEKSRMRAVLGALSWCAQQTAPHVSAAVSLGLSRIPKSKVQDIVELNRLVYKVKSNRDHRLVIHGGIAPKDLVLVAWVDASLQNRDDGKSTQGLVIGATSRRILEGNLVPVSLIQWSSTKIDRSCRSPGGSECRAAVNGEDQLFLSRLQLFEMQGGLLDPRRAEEQARTITGVIVTDSKNVFDRLRNTVFVVKGAEKRIAVEMMALKEAREANGAIFRWVHSDAQLANSLTKADEQYQLSQYYLNKGFWRIVDDADMKSARTRKQLGLGPLENCDKQPDAGGMQVSA